MATLEEIKAQELARLQLAYQQGARPDYQGAGLQYGGDPERGYGPGGLNPFEPLGNVPPDAGRQLGYQKSPMRSQISEAALAREMGQFSEQNQYRNTLLGDLSTGLDANLANTQEEIRRAIAQATGDMQEDFDYETMVGERNFDRQRRNTAEDFGDRIAIQDANIGREKKGLANANYAYREFMDRINPGFAEAVEAAERGAKATAAIEATFDENQGEIDAAYASAGGRVRAIADVVGAGGNGEVAAALHETVYEMKGFIDAQNGLNRQQTLSMHNVAANLAAAAAQQGLAQAEGEGSRSIYETQGQYEKIITNLIQQRDLLNNQQARALRNIDEAQADWTEGRDRDFEKRMEKYDNIDTTAFQANADWESYSGNAFAFFFEELNQDEGTAVPKLDRGLVQGAITSMSDQGWSSWEELASYYAEEITKAEFKLDVERANALSAELEKLAPYEDILEIGAMYDAEVQTKYNAIHAGNPTTPTATAVAEYARRAEQNLPADLIEILVNEKMKLDFPGWGQ